MAGLSIKLFLKTHVGYETIRPVLVKGKQKMSIGALWTKGQKSVVGMKESLKSSSRCHGLDC